MCSRSYNCWGVRLKMVVVVFVIIFIILFLNIITFIIIFIVFVMITTIIIIIIMFPATDADQNLYSYNHLTHLVLIVNGKYNVQISIMNILIGTKIFKNLKKEYICS